MPGHIAQYTIKPFTSFNRKERICHQTNDAFYYIMIRFFGLSRSDTALTNTKMGDWATPTCTVIDKNRKFVKNVIKKWTVKVESLEMVEPIKP